MAKIDSGLTVHGTHVLGVCTSGAFIGGKVGSSARMPALLFRRELGVVQGGIEGVGGWNDRVAATKIAKGQSGRAIALAAASQRPPDR